MSLPLIKKTPFPLQGKRGFLFNDVNLRLLVFTVRHQTFRLSFLVDLGL